MIDGLVAGRLYGEAERRTDKAGKAYSLAKVRASTAEGEVLFVNVIALMMICARPCIDCTTVIPWRFLAA